MADRPMRAPACMITSAFLAQLATCVGYLRCRLFIPRPCRTRIAAYIFSRVEMQNLRAQRFHGLCNNKLRLPTKGSHSGWRGCMPRPRNDMRGLIDLRTKCLRASRAASAQRRPVLWSSLIFLLVGACQWCAPSAPAPGWSLWLASDPRCGGVRGRAELDGRRTSLSTRKCVASGLVHC